MARKPRIEYPGALYHVMSRGNRRIKIFHDDEDRQRFLDTALKYKKKCKLLVYAYSLMDNHFHLLVEAGDVPLSKAMQRILQSYTQWHNRRYDKVGHLFQGRYRAILCDKETYHLVLIRYIHLNPVRSGYVDSPEEYQWSSHRAYLGLSRSKLVDVDNTLAQFSASKGKALKLYEEFINEGLGDGRREEYYLVRDQRILGDENFYSTTMKKIKQKSSKMDSILKNKTMDDIVVKVRELTGVRKDELCGKGRSSNVMRARSLLIQLCVAYTRLRKKSIAQFLNRQPGSLAYLEKIVPESEFLEIISHLRWKS